MNGKQTIEVKVEAKMTVSAEQAERCLRLLEMFLDDNPDITIMCEKKEIQYDKSVSMRHCLSLKRMVNDDGNI